MMVPPGPKTRTEVDHDLLKVIQTHGLAAVREAIPRVTSGRSGPKNIDDWSVLRPILQKDVEDWINGIDPFQERSDYLIAKRFAEENPGHSEESTRKRIVRKLKRKDSRRFFILTAALVNVRDGHPHELYLKALNELEKFQPNGLWSSFETAYYGCCLAYERKHGAPLKKMSIVEIETRVLKDAPQSLYPQGLLQLRSS